MNSLTIEQRIEAIQKDYIHGASYLGREALRTLNYTIESSSASNPEQLREEYLRVARLLLSSRPSMPAIGHLVVRATEILKNLYQEGDSSSFTKDQILEKIDTLITRCRKAHQDTVHCATSILKNGAKILTLSLSSNVLDTLLEAAPKIKQVLVAESCPQREGHEMATQLAKAKIPVTLITDAAMGKALGQVDLCLVGADGVLQDGGLINKTGSALLAMAASQRRIPFYAICETYKYHVGAVPFELEVRSSEEVATGLEGVSIWNYPFEIVPPEFVKGYLTELGIVTPHLAVQQILGWQRNLSGKRLFGKW